MGAEEWIRIKYRRKKKREEEVNVLNHIRQKSSVLPARLPLIKYEAMEGGESGCSICRKSFKEGEPCRVMHECGHKFHYLCVDPLVIKPTACPICRMSHLPFVYQMCA
ncbi:hypothetical protein CK203_100639 [Vitis vinifera]|uniref:RING-type domain-containing protein n=1 Tax=Vitis vinifera TaxID=29760 RepID=A0A438CHH1_VITVI|nr:hypothetical protein CK203_100639 [Vitis vinifera]